MASLVRTARDRMHGTPKDAPLEYSKITNNLYIGAWPTKYNIDTIKSLGINLLLSTILESVDKELDQPPLKLVKMRMSDALPKRPYYPTKTMMRGVDAALDAFKKGEKVMVFCKSGRHRSATTACCILIGQGYKGKEAMKLVKKKRSQADLNDALQKRILSFEKAWYERGSS